MASKQLDTGTRGHVAASTLGQLAGLRELPEAVIERIAGAGETARYDAGDIVVRQTDEGRDLFVILAGQARVSSSAPNGRVLTYQILDAGEFFGEIAAIDSGPRTAEVKAETDVVVLRLRSQTVDDLLATSPAFCGAILRRLARLSRRLTEQVFRYHMFPVRLRIYSEILAMTESREDAKLDITDRDMATRVGTTREYVTRIQNELARAGTIERSQHYLRVINRGALLQMFQEAEER